MIPFGQQVNATLCGGRQELLFGSQRLVGPGDYTQVPHTFDGAKQVGTFNQLFPNGHAFFGYIGRQNIISPNAGIALSPIRDLALLPQQYFFWRASDRDSIYATSSAVRRT